MKHAIYVNARNPHYCLCICWCLQIFDLDARGRKVLGCWAGFGCCFDGFRCFRSTRRLRETGVATTESEQLLSVVDVEDCLQVSQSKVKSFADLDLVILGHEVPCLDVFKATFELVGNLETEMFQHKQTDLGIEVRNSRSCLVRLKNPN